VDLGGTEALRNKLRAIRIGETQAVLREDWPRAGQATQ